MPTTVTSSGNFSSIFAHLRYVYTGIPELTRSDSLSADLLKFYNSDGSYVELSGTGITYARVDPENDGPDDVLTGGKFTMLVHKTASGIGLQTWTFDERSLSNLDVSGISLVSQLMGGHRDQLTGSGYNDVLHGGGSSALSGGDHYILGQAAGNDHIYLGGANPIRDILNYSESQNSLFANLTGLLISKVQYRNTIFADTIHGPGNIDFLSGPGHDIIYHRFSSGRIHAGAGDDLIRGYGGGDHIDGHFGNDTVDYSWFPAPDHRGPKGGALIINLGGGTATVGRASYEINLDPFKFEPWIASGDTLIAIEHVIGSPKDDIITGTYLANNISAGAGNDVMYGWGGNNRLDGGAGIDTLDFSWITQPGDYGGGLSVVFSGTGQGSAHHTKGFQSDVGVDAFFAIEKFKGGSNADRIDARLAGGSLEIDGGGGNDTIIGSSAGHLFRGGAGDDILYGNGGADRLEGGAGHDLLDGGTGIDVLVGSAGNDTYVVDNAGDIVDESLPAGGGSDTIQSSVTISLSDVAHVKGHIERLTLTGAAAINGAGNSLVNVLIGNSAANRLDGLGGGDIMRGLGGGDTYVVDNASDVVDESVAGSNGVDTVISSITFNLTDATRIRGSVENLTLAGSAAINAVGNSSGNTIIGNGGSNAIAGGLGNDTLTGGAGVDYFLFHTALNASTNVDRITDFSVPADTIRLENSVFRSLTAAGGLSEAAFRISSEAGDASDRIIYDRVTGALSYDADGRGGVAAIRFATLSTGLMLASADFVVV